MAKILVIFAHPNVQSSIVNRALRAAISSLAEVTIHDLYYHYPNFFIDVNQEQNLLLQHDVIVLQHPIYWYSCPALLKEWLDAVLEPGWAYGEGGDKLQGKYWLQAVSAGGPQDSYQRTGYNSFSLHELLRPFEQSARLCNMQYLTPFVSHGSRKLASVELDKTCARYQQLLLDITENKLPPILKTDEQDLIFP